MKHAKNNLFAIIIVTILTIVPFIVHAETMKQETKNFEQITEHRPWGYFVILDEQENYKLKRLVVYPGKRLSLQRHKHRSEFWTIIEGTGIVTLNDEKIVVHAGSTIHIKQTDIHRVENNGTENLVFVEIQTGSYFGEDDIERLADDFGRTNN